MEEGKDIFDVIVDGIDNIVDYDGKIFRSEGGEDVVCEGVIGESGGEESGCFI